MTTITIRDVPEEVRDRLADRAAHEGRSMQAYLRELLSQTVSRPTMGEVMDRARARVQVAGTTAMASAILADRDADRR